MRKYIISRVARASSTFPFKNEQVKRLIVHCGYHRAGSTWLSNILEAVARDFELRYQNCEQKDLKKATQIFLENHSDVNFTKLASYAGSHLIRDPRDIVISGYFYHLWTNEKWVHVPDVRYGNVSYQQYLKSLSKEEGILAQIARSAPNIRKMAQWDYNNEQIVELRYEQMIAEEDQEFSRMFDHYGFSTDAVERACNIAKQYSFKAVAGRRIGVESAKSHLRSGKPGDWRNHFTESHKLYFKKLLGREIITLKYEMDHDW